MRPTLNAILHAGIDLVFPPRCVGCKRIGWKFCPQCAQEVEAVGTIICERCGRPQMRSLKRCAACWVGDMGPLEMVRIAAIHDRPLRQVIHAFKYDGCPELADDLARYLVVTATQSAWRAQYLAADGILPVPLHPERQRERGYNQSEELAHAFCQQMALPFQPQWLSRHRSTLSQVGLSATERLENVNDAFVADKEVRGKRIILVDDVYTTGATLRACAHALKAAGATEVYGLVLACPR